MYQHLADNRIKIDLSFTEKQAVERVVEKTEWSQWRFDFDDEAMYVSNFDSFKDVLLVLTAKCVVAEEWFRNDGKYVLAQALVVFENKIKEIWSKEYE